MLLNTTYKHRKYISMVENDLTCAGNRTRYLPACRISAPTMYVTTWPESASELYRPSSIVRWRTQATEFVFNKEYEQVVAYMAGALLLQAGRSRVRFPVFNWHNPSSHTMVLRPNQPLTNMRTRNLLGGRRVKVGWLVRVKTLPPSVIV
jgi:hypothetical protein